MRAASYNQGTYYFGGVIGAVRGVAAQVGLVPSLRLSLRSQAFMNQAIKKIADERYQQGDKEIKPSQMMLGLLEKIDLSLTVTVFPATVGMNHPFGISFKESGGKVRINLRNVDRKTRLILYEIAAMSIMMYPRLLDEVNSSPTPPKIKLYAETSKEEKGDDNTPILILRHVAIKHEKYQVITGEDRQAPTFNLSMA